ncbi:MAG TPA: DNA helicase, partial [Clostridiales bacterium]|nr:DNA helicase [Clostridiales bacterium]
LWHYRSRHESLIAFSNRQYYENKLLTFPSPNDLVSRVRLIPVDGVYDRGRTKQNPAEARAVVAEIVRRLEDPVLSRQSLGVVSFSSVQQNLIEDYLTEVFRERPELEERAMQGIEPVFIKNLENVQGDERDVILFSVGYGPDKTGRVSLNFGPLNREGGWRRLNVAVSRARSEMLVFSTIQADQLDEARTGSQGVAGLKAFLEYAQRGRPALAITAGQAETTAPAGRSERSEQASLAARIANALEENGYQTQLLVGSSGYRIDIGIIDPDRPGEYILGILCNGATYRDARTTRDREILQQSVLKQLGWQLHQIWAVDWWENPAKEIRRILQHLEELRHRPQGSSPEA